MQGKLDSAEAMLGRALEIRRVHGGADTVMAGTLLDLADLANMKGAATRGDSLAHEALAILRRVAGERHLAVAAAMARVQSTQLGAGELAKPSPPAAPRSRCCASSASSGIRRWSRSSAIWGSPCQPGRRPRRSR